MVVPIIGLTLEEIGKTLATGALSWAGGKLANKLKDIISPSGASNSEIKKSVEEAKKSLLQIMNELDQMQTKIDELDKKIDNMVRQLVIEIKMDSVKSSVVHINTLYEDYTAALTVLIKCVTTDNYDKVAFQDAQKRCTEKGTAVANHVHDWVGQIHERLVGKGDILSTMHELHLTNKKDFIAQYYGLWMLLSKIFVTEFRAKLLLDYAREDPSVHFTDGRHAFEDVQKRMEEQQAAFDRLITVENKKLAMDVLQNPSASLKLTFKCKNGWGISRGDLGTINNVKVMMTWICFDWIKPGHRWTFAFNSKHPFTDANIMEDHYFSLTPDVNKPILAYQYMAEPAFGQSDVVAVGASTEEESRFKLEPLANGKFRITSMGDHYRGYCLTAGSNNRLWLAKNFDPTDDKQQFELSHWPSDKSYDPNAMSKEQADFEGKQNYPK